MSIIERIGKHQLIWGDCIEVMSIIGSGSVDAIICDPPYGTTACKWDAVIPLDQMWEQVWRVLKPNGVAVFTAAQPFTSALVMSDADHFRYSWTWIKNLKTGNLNARRRPMGGHEDIVVFCRGQETYNPQKRQREGERKSGNKKNSGTSVYGGQREFYEDRQSEWISPDTAILGIKCVHNASGKVHPTQKPVELMEYLALTYTNPGDRVLDFTMGSGTTGVACANTGRLFTGIERSEDYFLTACKRVDEATRQPDMFVTPTQAPATQEVLL